MRPATSKRLYLLRGLVFCSCGARMRGDTRKSRGQEWRYYSCPVSEGKGGRFDDDGNLVACHAKRVPADRAERFVVEALAAFVVPPEDMAAARRSSAPAYGHPTRARRGATVRLRGRLAKLTELYSWGDLTEADYRKQKAEAETQLAALPDNDKFVLFDRNRALAASLPDAVAAAPRGPTAGSGGAARGANRHRQPACRAGGLGASGAAVLPEEAADCDENGALVWRPRRDSNTLGQPSGIEGVDELVQELLAA